MRVAKKTLLLVLMLAVAVSFVAASGGAEPADSSGDMAASTARTGEYGEAPMLAALVASGDLPPVDERLPSNPKVVEMIEGIGNYGGDINVFAINNGIFNNDLQGMKGTSLLRIPRDGIGVEPDVAEGYEVSEDGLTITIHLREGMKWSDGEPFTTEDMRFANEDCTNNSEVRSWTNNGYTEVNVIDETTIEMFKPNGHSGAGMFSLADWFGGYAVAYQPAHYLKQFHGDYNENAQALAQELGYDTWQDAFRLLYWWAPLTNVDKPQVEPWELVSYSDTLKVSERNAFFFRVDEAGNQLPYIDRFIVQVVDPEVLQIKISGGESTLAYNQTRLDNLALYRQGAAAGGYDVTLHPGVSIAEMKMFINSSHGDPALDAIFENMKFRQAVSVAINRPEVQEVIYQGVGRAGAIAPLESASYYVDGWRDYYAQYDPALANRLLDEIGMSGRDSDGFRTRPDGEELSLVIYYTQDRFSSELELISEYLNEVDLRTTINLTTEEVLEEIREAPERDWFAWVHPNANIPPGNERASYGNAWQWGHSYEAQHWEDDKNDAVEELLGPGVALPVDWRFMETPDLETEWPQPPDEVLHNMTVGDVFSRAEMGSPEYIEAAREFFDYQVKRLDRIGTVGETPTILLSDKGLGNVVPPSWINGMPLRDDVMQTWMDQLYWK